MADTKDVVKIFLYSDIDSKVKRAVKYYNIDELENDYEFMMQVMDFSKDKCNVRIYNHLSSYSFSSFDSYIDIKVYINSSNIQVHLGNPLDTIKTINQTVSLSNTTLYLFNDKKILRKE